MADVTDRELLERAAKAAGYKGQWDDDWYLMSGGRTGWDPLTNDGDALRLAVKLKLDVRFPQDSDMYVDAGACDAYTVYLIDTARDRAAATRRAIVRAAAALCGNDAETDAEMKEKRR